MVNKFNLDGFSVSDADVCTADGGFVGAVTGNVTGDITGDVTGDVTGLQIPSPTTGYMADGAIDVTNGVATLNSVAATCAMTLATGSGQRLSIVATAYTNAMTVTADFGGTLNTATFSAAGEALDLLSVGSQWFVVGNNGVVLSTV